MSVLDHTVTIRDLIGVISIWCCYFSIVQHFEEVLKAEKNWKRILHISVIAMMFACVGFIVMDLYSRHGGIQ